MFYSQHVLTKKGPLAKIWLAAHMQSKLTKAMVFATDLRKAVETILTPDVPMALRLTSNLLLGVTRILHRKTKYLLQESSDALTKLKLTFRPSASVDLPPTAPNFAAVTLADSSVDGLAVPLVDLSLIPSRSRRAASSSAFLAADRDITIDEFAGGLSGGMLDAFALEPDLERDVQLGGDDIEPLLFTPSQRPSESAKRTPSVRDAPSSIEVTRAAGEENDPDAPMLSIERDAEGLHTPQASHTPERVVSPLRLTTPREGSPQDMTSPTKQPSPPRVTSPPRVPSPEGELREAPKTPVHADEKASPTVQPLEIEVTKSSGSQPADMAVEMSSTAQPTELTAENLPEKQPSMVEEREQDPTAQSTEEPGTEQSPALRASAIGLAEGGAGTPDAPMLDVGESPGGISAPRLSTGTDDFVLAEAEEGEGEGTQVRGDEPIDSPAVVRRGKKRKRVLIEDPATELSVEAFRACLNDTSDLLLGPNERRGGGRGRRPPMAYEELLSRPAIAMAPELSELFAQTFRLDDAEEVGSPMSDADLDKEKETTTEKKDKKTEASREEGEEKADVQKDGVEGAREMEKAEEQTDSPEKSTVDKARTPTPTKTLKMVTADPTLEEQEKVGGDTAMLQSEPVSTGRDVLPIMEGVEESPSKADDAMPLSQAASSSRDTARRLSFVPEDVDNETSALHAESVSLFDPNKITLRDVANTRSQVDNGEQSAEGVDVTETTISARTQKMQQYIREHLNEDGELSYSEAITVEPNVSRRIVARSFYELLNLSSKKALQLRQVEAYGTIVAKPIQPTFDSLASITI